MSQPTLDQLVKETRAAFVIAQADGELTAGEVIQIATDLFTKLQKLGSLDMTEKKNVLLLTLRKGLETSDLTSLSGMQNATKETIDAFIKHLLDAASTTIDMFISAATGKLDLRQPSSWMACLPICMNTVTALLPKEQALVKEAAKVAETKEEEVETKVTVVESKSVSIE
jgi:hypothetical protein